MKAMESLQDLLEEAKLRTVWWALCIFAVCYFLTHTSKSMWMNLPIAVLLVCGFRVLLNEVEFRRKVRNVKPQTYLSYLEKKQLSLNDPRLSTTPPPPKWKRKIDSPVVEAALEDFINKLLQDFVVDLWYSEITPDKEAPELIRAIIMDVLGEVSARIKEVNLVDLLTRDVVDLVGDHLDLFRKNQAAIGVDVMATLSSEERDERLKHHLLASKELHPALVSPECEYKVLQQLVGGVLATVLRPREAQCPLVRCIARELLTCLVMQPVMNFASPMYINELVEYIFLANKTEEAEDDGKDLSSSIQSHKKGHAVDKGHIPSSESSRKMSSSYNDGTDMTLFSSVNKRKVTLEAPGSSSNNAAQDEPEHPRTADWARILEAATQRRTEVLMPENLENMWTKGRNYKKKLQKKSARVLQVPAANSSVASVVPARDSGKEGRVQKPEASVRIEDKPPLQLPPGPHFDTRFGDHSIKGLDLSRDLNKRASSTERSIVDQVRDATSIIPAENKTRLKRSSSTSDLQLQPKIQDSTISTGGGPIISEFYSPDFGRRSEVQSAKSASDMMLHGDGCHPPKLKCRVMGAYFEKLGSKSFAVYSIAVTDADNNTWFVKRRYSNFERLHRNLKDIPNYNLHLPPKRIFSSSTEDTFVHQRCIQLDKYLKDLLSIANVAEQHEVWDFLSASSKNYSFGKSSSVMRTLAVNVDDAVDDIVRQFKGVSDGLMRKVVGSPSSPYAPSSSIQDRTLSWNADDINKLVLRQNMSESTNSFSDNEEGDKGGSHIEEEVSSHAQDSGWHSDSELRANEFPPRVVKQDEESRSLGHEKKLHSHLQSESLSQAGYPATSLAIIPHNQEDPAGVPPEWTPPNLSVPVLNLVDKIFQLKRRGWLRRQAFWMSMQILQLMMEDAIDDWLLRQIHWLRRDDIIAQGIRWVQDVLWPNGKFFLKFRNQGDMDDDNQPDQGYGQTSRQSTGSRVSKPGSFEQQLEATRRASDVKKMIFSGAPSTLVSLIGQKQYRRCARDIYYFLQSTICLKQLAYGILELLLLSIFPEMRNIVVDIHEKMDGRPL